MQKNTLFNQLISAQQEGFRDIQAAGFGNFEIDPHLKLARLLDRNIGRFYAVEQFDELPAHYVPENLYESRSIADQPAFLSRIRPLIDRGEADRRRARQNDVAVVVQCRRRQDVKRSRTRIFRCVDGAFDLFAPGYAVYRKLNSPAARRVL
jgi:hypothetical protein